MPGTIKRELRLKTPVLLLDREKCRENIAFMAGKAKRHNLILRPHFKTHQSIAIGEWFREQGTTKITVSSIAMAEYFAKNGWTDICVAFPFNIHEIDEAGRLAEKIRLHLSVCSAETLEFLAKRTGPEMGIYIKTDTGYHRTGIPWDDRDGIDRMLEITGGSKSLRFSGFMVHNGHTYNAPGRDEIEKIHGDSNMKLSELRKRHGGGLPRFVLSTGDTPACSVSENFEGIDEIRPGNYVFYDLSQCHTGSCTTSRVAVVLAAPVVAKHRERNEIVIYGGAVHLSKESLMQADGKKIWGRVVELTPSGRWDEPLPDVYVTKISQEHGIIKCDDHFFRRVKTGDFLGIMPVHSCLTADLMKGYMTTDGEKADHFSGSRNY